MRPGKKKDPPDILELHGNKAKTEAEKRPTGAYATNALTQYTVPRKNGPPEETDLAVEDAKERVDENRK